MTRSRSDGYYIKNRILVLLQIVGYISFGSSSKIVEYKTRSALTCMTRAKWVDLIDLYKKLIGFVMQAENFDSIFSFSLIVPGDRVKGFVLNHFIVIHSVSSFFQRWLSSSRPQNPTAHSFGIKRKACPSLCCGKYAYKVSWWKVKFLRRQSVSNKQTQTVSIVRITTDFLLYLY